MKRSPLKRKTPLAHGAPIKTRKPLSRTKPASVKHKPARRQRVSDKRWRSPEYLAWVRTLPCCHCGGPGGDAHHVIGLHWGLSGGGLTAPDNYAMPACRVCHQAIHQSPELQRWQPGWLRHVLALGVRQFDGEIKARLVRAWEFIDEREAA